MLTEAEMLKMARKMRAWVTDDNAELPNKPLNSASLDYIYMSNTSFDLIWANITNISLL